MPKLVVIDVANTLYRAFFAIPHLRASDGSPTNAVYGLANTLRKVIREESPDAVIVAQDPPGGSFRNELFPEYKAGRDAMPEDLRAQWPVARELIDAWGLPVVEVAGFEADDVIATLARTLPEDVELVIVSTDKDLMQLVGEHVVLFDGVKDVRIGPAEVEARFGVPPAKLLDLRALVGDSSDNIPGVKGIGEKGAAKLIGDYGTLECLLDHAGDVKAKRAREALQQHAAEARLSKQLATLRDDVPHSLDLTALPPIDPDSDALLALYKRLGFTRLVDDLTQTAGAPAVPAADVSVRIVEDAAALRAFADAHPAGAPLAVVLVGDARRDGRPRGLGGLALAAEPTAAVYVPLGDDPSKPLCATACARLEALGSLFDGPAPARWIATDTKRVRSVLAEHDLPAVLPDLDVELAAFLLDPSGARGTAALAAQWLDRDLRSWEDLAGRGARAKAANELPQEEVAAWAAEEACALLAFAEPLARKIVEEDLEPLHREIELPLTAVLSAMERNGVRIDEDALSGLSEEYQKELARIEAKITELAGEPFTIGSPKQLQRILFEKLKLPVIKKTKTGYSTDESVLEQLAAQHELPLQVLAYRRLSKLVSTYVDALPPLVDPETGRIHPIFHQTGAATGRLSSSNPNVQNIPIRTEEGIRIREAFVPAEGCVMLSADYSQLELRILAHFSADPSLVEAFRSGEDIHRRTAAEVAGIDPADVTGAQRAAAKAINFGIIYGSSAFGIANQLGIAQAEAQRTIDAYFDKYQGVRRFLDETTERARQEGMVHTLFGRRRYLPDLRSKNRVLRQAAERMAVNTVVQGTGADLVKRAMVDIDRALEESDLGARMILQVHDELVFEAPERSQEEVVERIRRHMESVPGLEVPLVVDVGRGANWRQAH